jgi:hypothetical protein
MKTSSNKSLSLIPASSDLSWNFLTNHAFVFNQIGQDSDIRLRDLAAATGMTERAAHRIVSQLADEGYIRREKQGRRSHYELNFSLDQRHPAGTAGEVGNLLTLLSAFEEPAAAA